jgi:hypothetical protein
MFLSGRKNDYHWHKCLENKPGINSKISRKDELAVAVTFLKLTSCLSTCNRTCRVFATDTDPEKETICG